MAPVPVDAGDFTSFARLARLARHTTTTYHGDDGLPISLTAWDDGVFRLRFGRSPLPDYGILAQDAPACETRPIALDDGVAVSAGAARLVLKPDPLRIELWLGADKVLESVTDAHFRGRSRLPAFGQAAARWTAAFALTAGEPVYGLGEKFGPLNKRGQLVHSYVEDALGVNTDLAYKNTPFAWSPRGWGVFVHTPASVSHGVGHGPWSHRSYAVIVDEPVLDLFFFAKPTPAALIDAYTRLTGRAAPVPLWSAGIWVSRAYYRDDADILATAKAFREKDFPADVITFDGRAWLETRTRFNFTWDRSRYPDPKAVIDRLKAEDFRICCWEYPLVSVHNDDFDDLAAKGYFLTTEEGHPYVFSWDTDKKTSPFGEVLTPLPDSAILDFTHPGAYAYWRDRHNDLFDVGVDVMKVDFGEQVPDDACAHNGDRGRRLHSVYPLLYNRCVYEASRARYGDDACVWSRAGWAGSQRYPLQWGGDPQSDWEGLAASLRGGLSWGLSGAPYHATDIGGFYGATQPDGALYLRWVQAGVFASHFRIHGIGPREPWCFGPDVERIARDWFKLRYRLIPYLMGAMAIAVRDALPVMRAMVLAFPDDRLAHGFEHQFMCGPSLLIAPVLSPDDMVDVWLPEGRWHDVWTGTAYEGGQRRRWHVDTRRIPVFLKDGHGLPLGPAHSHTGQIDPHRPADGMLAFGPIEAPVCCLGDAVTLRAGVAEQDGMVLPRVATLAPGTPRS